MRGIFFITASERRLEEIKNLFINKGLKYKGLSLQKMVQKMAPDTEFECMQIFPPRSFLDTAVSVWASVCLLFGL